MKKRVHILFLALLAAALAALTASAAGDYTVSVIPAPAGDYAAVADIPVTVGADELFCGWFTTESAARSLNRLYAAEKAADARYGAVLQLPEAGALRLIGAQMYTKSPYGVRFVTETDKSLLRTLERLHGKNRAGKNDSITPKNEHATGIGYGTVLALDLDTTVPLEKKSGRNVRGGITVPGYAASKGAVGQLVKALANEWAGKGVNVNGIAPGYIATDNTAALRADPTRSRQILERIPAGRWGDAEDIAGACVFLCSPAANYIHGAIIPVDGGWLAR